MIVRRIKSHQLLLQLVFKQFEVFGTFRLFLLLFVEFLGCLGRSMVLGIEVHMNKLDDIVLIFVQGFNVVVQFQKMGSNFIL